MSTGAAVAIYFIIWWLTLFVVLPFGVRSQLEEGQVVPGSERGAPARHGMLRSVIWTTLLSVVIGFMLSSAFSAILVYAQELIPGNVGLVSGLFFGFAFGMGGLGAACLGLLADRTSVDFVYETIAYLPLLGVVTALLPRRRA